ncbi:MAG: TetR/AcrR family transcriptional regulator [Bacteroidales bacterium]|nr:TetR/AcrR family transcriptional regulator [Bacteroidales bacterium]
MSPRTKEQNNKIREERRLHIMDVALELFANNGYHPTSISKIALSAKISKGLIYNYFDSKEELLSEIVLHGTLKMHEPFDQNHDGILTTEEFAYYIREIFRIQLENPHFWKLFFSLMMQANVYEKSSDSLKEISIHMQTVLFEFFKKQQFEDPQLELILFAATIKGSSLMILEEPDKFPVKRIIESIIERYSKPNK